MTSEKQFWISQDLGMREIPRILIISDSLFIARHLMAVLKKSGSKIFYFVNTSIDKNEIKNFAKNNPDIKVLREDLPDKIDYLFFINNGPVSGQKLNPGQLYSYCQKQPSKILFATTNRDNYPRTYFNQFAKNLQLDYRLVYFSFVWGRLNHGTQTLLETLLSQTEKNKLLISGTGEEKIYPLYIDDFIAGLCKAMFSANSRLQQFFLAGEEKITLVDFAWQLKKVFQSDFKIETIPNKNFKIWQVDSLTLEKIKKSWWMLGQTLQTFPNLEMSLVEVQKSHPAPHLVKLPKFKLLEFKFFPKKIPQLKIFSKKTFLILGGGLTILVIFLLPPFLTFFYAFLGYRQLNQALEKIKNNDFSGIAKNGEIAQKRFAASNKIFQKISPIFYFLGLENNVLMAENSLSLADQFCLILQNTESINQNAKSLTEIMLGKKLADPKNDLSSLQLQLAQVHEQLATIQLQLDQIKIQSLPLDSNSKQQLEKLAGQLPDLRTKIAKVKQLLSLTPYFLAFEDKKTYLVLFQNNMELRPTGGFIGSFGLLTFSKGRLIDFQVEDVWNADGQLQGHVDPPAELGGLGETNWYLRDSNFSPDFPQSARQAEWFLEKEIGKRVDGTIAVNLNFVKSLLQIAGPLEVTGYSEKITSDNLFERAEYQAEVDFFPGSTQKKSFLSELSGLLFEKIKELPPEKMPEILAKIDSNLESRDVFLYFHEPILAGKIKQYNWDGEVEKISLNKTSQFSGPGLGDYLMIVDANVGVNKANYFITRKIFPEITIAENGTVAHILTLIYKNSSPSQSWPGGTYKNYLRLYLPEDVEKISVNESIGQSDQLKPITEKIREVKEFQKSVFGFLVNVIPGEEKKLVITYQRKEKIPLNNKIFDYAYFLQKQSGIGLDPVEVKINYPEGLKPVKIMPQGTWKLQSLIFIQNFDTDKLFAVEFSR